jgi:hypothetical protein
MCLEASICVAKILAQITDLIEEKEKKLTRFQLSLLAISKFSGKQVVDTHYLASLQSEFLERGWSFFQIDNTRYGAVLLTSVESWKKITAKEKL